MKIIEKLNVGCGKDVKEGWINLDQHNRYGADIIFDLNKIFGGKKMPFQKNNFDYIYCSHVLEDFNNPLPILNEFVRICKVGGKIEIRTPFETNTFHSLNHKRAHTLTGFNSFCTYGTDYGIDKQVKVIKSCYYRDNIKSNKKGLLFLKKAYINFAVKFYNLLGPRIVEQTFIKYLFPCVNIKVIYEKIK